MQITREGMRKDSELVILEFEEEVLPKNVTLGFMSYSVREYVPKPMRCYNTRCYRWYEDHEYGHCNHEQPKCCNCGGSHSVAYSGWEVMRREIEVQ